MNKLKKIFIVLLASWLFVSTSFITIVTTQSPIMRAVFGMAWGLIILWIVVGGTLMYRYRDKVKNVFTKIPLPWPLKFVVFATGLMLIEEAITTLMTNLAPVFGVKIGQAYITASANYFDVILFHSVIFFVGPFVFWVLVLRKYDFSPFATFLIFGITGVLAEAGLSGLQAIAEFGLWIFVYGLIIYLPTYCILSAQERGAKPAKWYGYILMIFLPLLFVPLFAWIPHVIDPNRPTIEFPPMTP